MSARRIDNTPDKQGLKDATGRLVRGVGGVEAADGFCRAGFRRLSEYQRKDNDCFAPIDVIADLEAVTHGQPDHPVVTRYLARRSGYALMRYPTAAAPTCASAHMALADATREGSEVSTGLLAALADGKFERGEAEQLMDQALEAAEAFMRMHALMKQIAEVC